MVDDEIIYDGTFYVDKEITCFTIVDYLDDSFVPKPVIYLDYNQENDSFVIKTQNLLLDKALTLYCYYTDDLSNNDVTTWNKMEIDFTNDNIVYDYSNYGVRSVNVNSEFNLGSNQAYFYFEIPVVSAVDKQYKIVFYNFISSSSGDITYYDFNYDNSLDYVQNELNYKLGLSVRLNELLRYFRDRLGFLLYPLDFINNLFNRILSIQYKEPVLHFPAIYLPYNDTLVFEGFDFNFNSLLEFDNVPFIYNIYLNSVDFILIIGLVVLSYKTLMEVVFK